MKRTLVALALGATLLVLWTCGSGQTPAPGPAPPAKPGPEEPTILLRPFTADEIRGEWVVGLTLTMLLKSPEGEERQIWKVVSAGAEGCEIEYTRFDAEGDVLAEPTVAPAGWVELRDHASFEADVSTREEVRRDTALGELEGWLYTVRDDDAGTVTEYFFAESLPGAPVELRVTKGGVTVSEMLQVERSGPGDG